MPPRPPPIATGHNYGVTKHISFKFFKQASSPATFGYDYFLSLPPSFDSHPDRQWPLLLFLHGAGESQRAKNESYVSLRHGIPKIILCYDRWKDGAATPHIEIPPAARFKSNPSDRSPQPVSSEVCALVAEEFITVTPSLDMQYGYGWNSAVLSALLDEVVQGYPVDLDRVHVTGFSMGGYGTWDLAMRTPKRFASLVPICGGADTAMVKNIKHIPQWIHHGVDDDIIPLEKSIAMERALRSAGAPEILLTTYPNTGHDSWTDAYNNLELFKWILEKKRTVVSGEEVAIPDRNKVDLAAMSDM